MSLCPANVGDCGQRYEICAKVAGVLRTVGWCEREPERMARAALAMPSATRAWVIDRRDGRVVLKLDKER